MKNCIDYISLKKIFVSFLVIGISSVTGMGNEVHQPATDDKGQKLIEFHEIKSAPSIIKEGSNSATVYKKADEKKYRVASDVDTLSNDGPEAIAASANNSDAPNSFRLKQNYPNPFNPATEITYKLPLSEHVILKVYDMLGRPVKTLVNKTQDAGSYTVRFNADGLTSGMYLYRLKAGDYEQIRKMILIK